MPGSGVPEYLGVFFTPHGNVSDYGFTLYTQLPLLCGGRRPAWSRPMRKNPPESPRVARQMGLKYVVVTSVTRDDLPDGGAAIFAETIEKIRQQIPDVYVEVLIPDFQGSKEALETVLNAHPDVLNHNIETVPRLYPEVRPQADYRRSLELIQRAHKYDRPCLPSPASCSGWEKNGRKSTGPLKTWSKQAAAC